MVDVCKLEEPSKLIQIIEIYDFPNIGGCTHFFSYSVFYNTLPNAIFHSMYILSHCKIN